MEIEANNVYVWLQELTFCCQFVVDTQETTGGGPEAPRNAAASYLRF